MLEKGRNGKIEKELSKIKTRNAEIREELISVARLRVRYQKMIYYLSSDGLLDKRSNGDIHITPKGKKKLCILEKRSGSSISPQYPIEKSNKVVIVVYDIPESRRQKRYWLRSALKNLGLKMIQKSVWLGKVAIPKAFLEDLKDLRLVEFVEIFEVSKKGTLRYVV